MLIASCIAAARSAPIVLAVDGKELGAAVSDGAGEGDAGRGNGAHPRSGTSPMCETRARNEKA